MIRMICFTIVLLIIAPYATSGGESNPGLVNKPGAVSGSVTYRERIALPPNARIRLELLDVPRQDVVARLIAVQTIIPEHQVPVPFELSYDPQDIDERMNYTVRATILSGNSPVFVTSRSYAVLTHGNPAHADLVLVRSGGNMTPVAAAGLANTRWLLRTLGDGDVQPASGQPTPFLQFRDEEGGAVAFGSSGCNNFRGSYEVKGPSLTFGMLASTMKACPDMSLELRFHQALDAVNHHEIDSTWLILSGPGGRLATFEAWYE